MMKSELQLIEAHLLKSIKDTSGWILGSPEAEEQLVHDLILEIGQNLRVDSEQANIAPNIFLLSVPADSINIIRSRHNNIEEFERNLATAGNAYDLKFRGPISINIFPDEILKSGQFKILAIWKYDDETLSTVSTPPSLPEMAMTAQPPKAFLIVEGTKIFTLDQEITNIGRNIDNHLVLDDIRVSRDHAQIRVVKGRHMLFDLDSSGGTFINNKRISKMTLHPGDIISLAGIPLVYGQDAASKIDDSNEYTPPDNVSNASTTTMNINKNDSDTLDK